MSQATTLLYLNATRKVQCNIPRGNAERVWTEQLVCIADLQGIYYEMEIETHECFM